MPAGFAIAGATSRPAWARHRVPCRTHEDPRPNPERPDSASHRDLLALPGGPHGGGFRRCHLLRCRQRVLLLHVAEYHGGLAVSHRLRTVRHQAHHRHGAVSPAEKATHRRRRPVFGRIGLPAPRAGADAAVMTFTAGSSGDTGISWRAPVPGVKDRALWAVVDLNH